MSSTIQPRPNAVKSPLSLSSILDSSWGRLLWKDAREIVPVWITLSLAAVLCLMVTFWMINRKLAHIAPLYISGHTFIALCSVITGVFLLANEDENRTLHLLRNLPLRPRQILWQKLVLGSTGVLLISCFIAAFTMVAANFVQSKSLEANSPYGFTVANVMLLPLLYLTISLLSAMRSRSLFYGVLIAGFVSIGVIWILEPTWLGAKESTWLRHRSGIRWLWVTLAIAGGVLALVLNAGQWVEEKVGKQKSTRANLLRLNPLRTFTAAKNTQANVPLGSTLTALLWQSFRQSRTPILSCVALVILGWLIIPIGLAFQNRHSITTAADSAAVVCVMSLFWMLAMMIAFASTIFLDDKRNNNFLFFQQNRERARWFWLSRVLPFWAAALTLVLAWKFFIFDPAISEAADSAEMLNIGYNISRTMKLETTVAVQVASQSLLVPLLGMLAIIGIGQFFSMFIRNPILSFVFTGITSTVFLAVSAYIVFANESVWWTLVPIVAATYAATWWRSKSWLATSPKVFNYFLPLTVPAIVMAVIAPAFINHRATQFDDLVIKPTGYAAWLSNANTEMNRKIKLGTESQANKAADLYRDAVDLWKGNYAPNVHHEPMPWPEKQTANYVDENENAIAKILKAAEVPICAPFLAAETETRLRQIFLLREMALVKAHHELLQGNLLVSKRAIDAYDRVWQRTNDGLPYNRQDSGYYGLLSRWADHPNQTADAIKSAIAQLEGVTCDIEPICNASQTDQVKPQSISPAALYREFGGEQFFMDLQQEIARSKRGDSNRLPDEMKNSFWLMPWEYQRFLKVTQRRAVHFYQEQTLSLSLVSENNDRRIVVNQFAAGFAGIKNWPLIPIAEDRFGLNYSYQTWRITDNRVDEINWRRYALLRLGLAVYKIEKNEYPEDLLQLRTYYQRGLPILTSGQMFAWYKNGLEHDLASVVYKDQDSEIVTTGKKLADGQVPVLLPFAIDPTQPFPKPVEYQKGKLGFAKDRLTKHRLYNPYRIESLSQYPLKLNVGVTKKD